MKFSFKQSLNIFIAALIFITPTFSWSAIPSRISEFITPDYELDLQKIAKMDRLTKTKPLEVRHIIPMDMQATNNDRKVAAMLLSHTLNSALNSDMIRETSVGNAAGRVAKGVGTNMTWVEADGLIHKVNLKAKGTVASLTYKGYLRANLSYEAIDGKLDFEVSKKLSSQTKLVFNHTDDEVETLDTVGLSWTW